MMVFNHLGRGGEGGQGGGEGGSYLKKDCVFKKFSLILVGRGEGRGRGRGDSKLQKCSVQFVK